MYRKQAIQTKILLVGDSLANGGAEKVQALLSFYFYNLGFEIHHLLVTNQIVYEYKGKVNSLNISANDTMLLKLKKFLRLKKIINKNNYTHIIDFRIRTNFFLEMLFSSFYANECVFYTVHSAITNFYLPKPKKISKYIYSKTQKNIMVAKSVQEKYIPYKIKNTMVIYNPIDVNKNKELAEEFLPKYANYFLAVGSMNNNIKQFDELINTFKNSNLYKKNYHLVILGKGVLKENLQMLIQSFQLENYVHLLGWMPNPFPYYKNAICTINCSKEEGFSNVITESLSVGTPVIAFKNVSGIEEIITHNYNGILLENQDFNQLKTFLENIESNFNVLDNCRKNTISSVNHLDLQVIGKIWANTLGV